MRLAAKLCVVTGILVSFAFILHASLPLVKTGTWSNGPALSDIRAGAAVVQLTDGRLLVAGGINASGAVNSADIFDSGAFASTAVMHEARSDYAAVVLQDGRVLVTGGAGTTGAATNSAEIYDPVAGTWTAVATNMSDARSGHTASLLPDGRVLLAGGANSSGAVSSVEIYDPTSGTFAHAGTMSSPRQHHSAATLSDGRVMLIGGDDGSNPLATTDIYDPSTGTIAAGPNMSVPRRDASATTALDGTVIVVGGNNGSTDLASIEIYDAAQGTFHASSASLTSPRSGHKAFLLPHNNSVFVVGGNSAGTDLASAELYLPWNDTVQNTGAMSVARPSGSGSTLQQDGLLLMAGGKGLSSSEYYGFATVKTDAADYAPGTPVTITGGGWQPGETVTLTLVESPLIDTHPQLTAVADANGNISNSLFAPDNYDLNIRFYLTAVGSQSGYQAQTTFTDGPKDSLDRSPNNFNHTLHPGDPIPAGDTFSFTVTNNSGSTTFPVNMTVVLSGPFGSVSPTSGQITGYGSAGQLSATVSGTVPCNQPTGAVTLNVVGTLTSGANTINPDHVNSTVNITVTNPPNPSCTVGKATPAITWANPADITYGTALSATQLNATASVPGSFVYTPAAGTVLNAGNNQSLHVDFTPTDTTNYNTASKIVQINVQKATPTVTWTNPSDITYGTMLSGTQLNATFSWVVNGATVTVAGTPTYTPPSGTVLNAGNGQTLSVSFAPTDTTNYDTASKTVQINVQKATPTVTWADPSDITYGTALSGTQLNATFSWVVNGATVTVAGTPTYTPPSGAVLNAGNGQTLSVSFAPTDTTNYNTASKTVQINVQKATPTVTWADPSDITYGTALSGTQLNATFSWVVNGATVTVAGTPTYTPPSGTVLNAGNGQTLSVSFAPTDTTNYDTASKTVQINVQKAIPTVTWTDPSGITYGTALSGTQLNATFSWVVNGATVTVAGTPTYTPPSGAVLNAGNGQTLSVSFAPTDTTNYDTASKTVQINVQKAIPTVTWADPSGITYGTALSGTQLNATFSWVVNGATVTVAGTPTYTPPSGTVLNAGNGQTLSVSFAPTDTTNYDTASKTVQINVQKAIPTVTWADPSGITYGTALSGTQLNATFSWVVNGATVTVAGTPTYTPPSGTVLNAGNGQTLSVSFAPTDTTNYDTASKTVQINVQKATPTVTWADPSDITYGTALSGTQLNATFSWVVNGATVTVAGTPTYTPPSGTVLNAGNGQTLSVSFAPTDTTNYDTASKTVQINVQKATPTVTWANPSDITYGTALSGTQLNATFSWVVNGATVTVAGTPKYAPSFGAVLNPGANQSLNVTFSPSDTTNYNATSKTVYINVSYGPCLVAVGPGGVILPPINGDGTSVYRKGGSTIPVKFRVCDASGAPISNPALVFAPNGSTLSMLGAVRGTIDSVNEDGTTDVPDVAFRYSGGQWIFNMATSNLAPGQTYTFRINLEYGNIVFMVGVK